MAQSARSIRIAEYGEQVYLDLADEHWRAVEIGPDGWQVIGSPPVLFRRPAGMLPLPMPEPGGSIEALNSLLNLPGRNDFVLIVAWLLAALRSGGPYPLLAISGEQGSAKTVLSKLLKALVDPSAAPVRALSREQRELMIAANNGFLLAFDNLFGLPHLALRCSLPACH
jgi:ABC-type protease/lipase transport system fused ATPase/permease subunit